MAATYVQVVVRLSPELHRHLVEVAASQQRAQTAVIREALARYLEGQGR